MKTQSNQEKKKKKKTLPSSTQGVGSIPGQRTNVSHTLQLKNENLKQKHYCKKFSKDFKNGPHQKKKSYKKKTKTHQNMATSQGCFED